MHICIECLVRPANTYKNHFCYECYEEILNEHIEKKFNKRLKEYRKIIAPTEKKYP